MNESKEKWRFIPGYEKVYSISNIGRIKSHRNNKILKDAIGNSGYRMVELNYKGVAKRKLVHRLILESFIGNMNGYVTNHKDGNKLNNNIDNLERVTQSENVIHSIRIGLKVPLKGMELTQSKLNNEEVVLIRKEYSNGNISQRALAKKYGICQGTIMPILNHRTWRHV